MTTHDPVNRHLQGFFSSQILWWHYNTSATPLHICNTLKHPSQQWRPLPMTSMPFFLSCELQFAGLLCCQQAWWQNMMTSTQHVCSGCKWQIWLPGQFIITPTLSIVPICSAHVNDILKGLFCCQFGSELQFNQGTGSEVTTGCDGFQFQVGVQQHQNWQW